jgi:hypothetical protein
MERIRCYVIVTENTLRTNLNVNSLQDLNVDVQSQVFTILDPGQVINNDAFRIALGYCSSPLTLNPPSTMSPIKNIQLLFTSEYAYTDANSTQLKYLWGFRYFGPLLPYDKITAQTPFGQEKESKGYASTKSGVGQEMVRMSPDAGGSSGGATSEGDTSLAVKVALPVVLVTAWTLLAVWAYLLARQRLFTPSDRWSAVLLAVVLAPLYLLYCAFHHHKGSVRKNRR